MSPPFQEIIAILPKKKKILDSNLYFYFYGGLTYLPIDQSVELL